jgi:hypothetical protein
MKSHHYFIGLQNPSDPLLQSLCRAIKKNAANHELTLSEHNCNTWSEYNCNPSSFKNGREGSIEEFLVFCIKSLEPYKGLKEHKEHKEQADSPSLYPKEIILFIDFNLGYSSFNVASGETISIHLKKEFPQLQFRLIAVGSGGGPWAGKITFRGEDVLLKENPREFHINTEIEKITGIKKHGKKGRRGSQSSLLPTSSPSGKRAPLPGEPLSPESVKRSPSPGDLSPPPENTLTITLGTPKESHIYSITNVPNADLSPASDTELFNGSPPPPIASARKNFAPKRLSIYSPPPPSPEPLKKAEEASNTTDTTTRQTSVEPLFIPSARLKLSMGGHSTLFPSHSATAKVSPENTNPQVPSKAKSKKNESDGSSSCNSCTIL